MEPARLPVENGRPSRHRSHEADASNGSDPVGPPCSYGAFARAIVKSRAAIGLFFNPALFGDPAFDLLLELYAADEEDRKVQTTHCAYASRVPETTSLRWLGRLEKEGLIVRVRDPEDGRRNLVRLTPTAHEAVLDYLRRIAARPAAR